MNEDFLQREPQTTPADLSDNELDGLTDGDPTSGLAQTLPPEPNSGGGAELSYPLEIPKGRGLTPELNLEYASGGGSSWAGYGWSFGVGDISVDTTYGAPLFCPRMTAPKCGKYESESYLLNGEPLMPTAVRTDLQQRIPERQDFTRKQETQYEHIIRHGDGPSNYWWEVRDKMGNISWYGGYPDGGGPFGDPGVRGETDPVLTDDRSKAESAILTDGSGHSGNAFRWYLKAQRDVGVNMIRYEYDTVQYKGTGTTNKGITWTKLTGPNATCTGLCAKHIYLSRIFYTGAAEASGQPFEQPEDPAYEVRLIRAPDRRDAILDARGGFLDLDSEQLSRIEVWYTKTNKLAVAYDLNYEPGAFGKTMLASVTQVGCPNGSNCKSSESTNGILRAKHTFDYHDDRGAAGDGFTTDVPWTTGKDDLEGLEGRASALGMSSTNGGDGKVYIGFNPTAPSKMGSFGGSVSFDGADTESKVEMLDINGDSLPDKLFRKNGVIKYRLNTSKTATFGDLTKPVTFTDPIDFQGADTKEHAPPGMPKESSFGVTGGVEVYFGINVMFNAGGNWSWTSGYFTDVNGDGLPDFTDPSSSEVWFNHLECPTPPLTGLCKPLFTKNDSSKTRLPLNVRAVNSTDDTTLQQTIERLKRLSPPIDTVRRWVAPYDGRVRINSTATIAGSGNAAPATCATGGVRLAIQHEEEQLRVCSVSANESWHFDTNSTPNALWVLKGDAVYFRVGPDLDVLSTKVDWDPQISYLAYGTQNSSTPASGTAPDVNGLSQRNYSASSDFTLAGRPGQVGMPDGGTVLFSGRLNKTATTTDDVRPTITHTPGDKTKPAADEPVTVAPVLADGTTDASRVKTVSQNQQGDWCLFVGQAQRKCFDDKADADALLQVIFGNESGLYDITASIPVAAPIKDANNVITAQDVLETSLAIDSPVDVRTLSWVTIPRLCYKDPNGSGCKTNGAEINPPVDTDVYPETSEERPRAATAWGDDDRTVTVHTTFDVSTDHEPGPVVVTIKSAGGTVKHVIDVTGTGHEDADESFDFDIKKGTAYWYDVSVRNPALAEHISDVNVELKWEESQVGHTEDVPEAFNQTGRQGWFGLSWRGWGVAGYRGDSNRRTERIDQSKFDLSKGGDPFDNKDEACQQLFGGSCDSQTANPTFPGSYSSDYGSGGPGFDEKSVDSKVSEVYAFTPTRTIPLGATVIQETWTGPKAEMNASATGLEASRLGSQIPQAPGAGSSNLVAPILQGKTSPSLAVSLGAGPAMVSGAFGWSNSSVDYVDMNGDGFPDVVKKDSITYTDPRGGKGCRVSDTSLEECSGGGVEAVDEDTTINVGGGLSGAPVAVKANAKGKTVSTKGGSASKGGPANKGQYGAEVGAGASVGFSWASPMGKDPKWATADFGKVPGNPVDDTGAVKQKMLADINGDGLPDQVKVTTQGVFVRFNLGYTFTSSDDWVLWADASGFESGESGEGAFEIGVGFSTPGREFSGGVSRNAAVDYPRFTWTDVNGDGTLDALVKTGDITTPGEVKVAFGTGAGLTGGAPYGNNQTLPFQFLGDIKVGTGNQARQDTSIGYGGGFDFTVSFGPLCAVACYLIVNPGAHFEHSETTTDVDLTDVNGDGFADSIRRETADRSIQVRLNKQFRTGLLKSVHNPLGGSFDIDYERKGNTTNHPSSTWVMSKLTLHDGRPDDGVNDQTSTFAYDNDELKFDFVHRRDLGFSRVVTRELAEDGNTVLRATRQRFLNDDVLDAGLNTSVELFDGDVSDANLVQRTTQTWSIPDGETGLPVDYAALSTDEKLKAWSTPLLRRVDDQQFARGTFPTPSQATATTYDYDSLGNPSTVHDLGDLNTPSDDLTATVIYTNCEIAASDELAELCGKGDASNQPPFWNPQVCPTWTNIPAIITVRSADGTVIRRRDGSQDLCDNSSVTLLKELISGPINGGEYAETQLTYDDWGSYDRIVYPLGANGRHYAVHYEYDDTNGHANVAQVTDYELLPDEVGRFMDGPVGAGGDLPDGGGEAWLAGKVSRLSGNTFTLSIADDPSPVDVDVELSGSAPAWLANGADAVAFGTLADDHSTLSDAKVYRDFSEPWGKNGGPPLEADSVGLTSISTFDPLSGQVASRTDPNGNKTTYSYDVLRRLSSIVTADNGRVDYTYHLTNPANPPLTADSYALAKHSDAFRPGDTIDTAVLVDGLGRTIQKKHEVDLFSGLNGSPANQLAVTDTVKFDALGRETFTQLPVTQALAGLTSYRTIQGGEAGTTRAYDFLDRVTSETKPDGRVTSAAYGFKTDLGTSLTTAEVTDPMKRKTKTFIDTRGFVRAVDDIAVDRLNGNQPVYRAPLRTLYDNDPLGNPVDVFQAGRTQVHNTYDLLGRRTSTATEDGGLTTYGYDSSGNQVSKQTAAQRADSTPSETHQTTYDYSFGNLVHIEYPEGTPDVTMQWGGLNGAPSSANGAGRLVDVTDGARHQTLGYDVHGNVITEADEMLDDHWKDGTLTTRWSYDWLGRARTMTYPDGETLTNDYDRGGLLSKVSGAKSCTQLGSLTASVNLTQTTITVQETPHEVNPTPPFTIKVDGETMQVTNRVPQPGSAELFTYTVVRGFGGSTIALHSSGASVTSTSGLQCSYRYVDRLEYDKFGSPQFQQVGNRNRTQYFRNALNRRLDRQETVSPQQGSRVQQNLTYTYDDADNVTKYVDDLPADTSALMGGKVTQNYRYDPYYRIVHGDGLWETAPKTDRHYAYDLTYDDPTGNVKTKTQRDWENKAGCTSNCNEFVFDATTYSYANTFDGGHQHRVADQGGETFTYDPNGNVTRILHANGDLREMDWNDDGRMTMIIDRPNGTGGKPTFYTYDMNGQLAIEDKEQGRSWFVNPYVTVKNGTMWKNIVAGDDRVGVKASQQDVLEQKLYFLHKDLQGSTNIVTDSTGRIFQHHQYFPSGEVWVDEKSTVFRTPYQFAGEYNDEDHGMLDLGERWYDPRRERMPSVDAAVADDPTSIVDDQTIMAAYSFTGSNPLSYFDPDGRERFLLTRLEKQSVALKLVDAGFKREELIFTGFRAEKVGLQPGGITPAVTKFFDKHDGLGARLGYFVLTHYKGLAKLQSFSEKIDTPPLVEFEFDFTKAGWKMKNVRNQKVKLLGKKVPPRKTAGGKSGSKP